MPKTTEITSISKDVQGRYLCNDFFEAESWRRDGGRPFDFIVIGGGTFGAVIAEHLWFRQRQSGGGLRTLVVAAAMNWPPPPYAHQFTSQLRSKLTLPSAGTSRPKYWRTYVLNTSWPAMVPSPHEPVT